MTKQMKQTGQLQTINDAVTLRWDRWEPHSSFEGVSIATGGACNYQWSCNRPKRKMVTIA